MTPKKFKAVTKEGNTIDVASIQFMEDGSCIVNDEFPIAEGKLISDDWISVEESEPKKDGEYVCYSVDYEIVTSFWWIKKQGRFMDRNNKGEYELSELGDSISHYQPLPAPPNSYNKLTSITSSLAVKQLKK